jgi:nicotinamidase-related amidase
MLIKADHSCVLIVDFQVRLAPAMVDSERTVANAAVLMRAAPRFAVPVIVTEQYPRGIGPTVPELADLMPPEGALEKVHFAALDDAGVAKRVAGTGRRQMIVTGMEAHICVLQTAMALLREGSEVFVVADAVASRTAANRDAALGRMAAAGIQVVTTEMVVFEWLERAATPLFKDMVALIK